MGRQAKIMQWCNDWFSVEIGGVPKIVSPTSLKLTELEMKAVMSTQETSGILFELFQLRGDGTFKRRPRKAVVV